MASSQSLGRRGPSSGKALRGGKALSSTRPIPAGATASRKGTTSLTEKGNTTVESPKTTLPRIGRIIVGVDMGTTLMGVATLAIRYNDQSMDRSLTSRYTPKVFDNWLGRHERAQKFPSTAVYYDHERALPYTGNSLASVLEEPEFDRERLIKLLKLQFHHHNNDPTIMRQQVRVQRQLDREGKTADEVLRDIAKIILDELFAKRGDSSYLEQQYDHFERYDLELVIAVPPGRMTVDHERVRAAFIQGLFSNKNVYLESEPAAMFRSWVHEGESTRDWKIGNRYLICDCGGGTCCFVRYHLDRLSPTLGFRQEYSSESIAWGAETISDAFERLAASKVPLESPWREEEISRMRAKFDDVKKMTFGNEAGRKKVMSFEKMGLMLGHWQFSYDEIASCFDPCIEKLITGLQAQLQNRPKVDCLVLGGGLSSNPYVLSCLRKRFADLQIRELGSDKKHVVVGSVLSRVNDDFLMDYPIHRSKAVITWYLVDSTIKRLRFYQNLIFKKGRDGKMYFLGGAYLVKKGDNASSLQKGISSENSAKDARQYQFNATDKTPEFSEEIVTLDVVPGKDEWAALLEDGNWVDMRGNRISSPYYSEEVTWSPFADGGGLEVDLAEVEDGQRDGKGSQPTFKLLRYSIEMKVTETTTKTWVKVWSSKEMKRRTGKDVAFISHPRSQKPIFRPQQISKSLAEGYDLDEGISQIRKLAGVGNDKSAKMNKFQNPAVINPGALMPTIKPQTTAENGHATSSKNAEPSGSLANTSCSSRTNPQPSSKPKEPEKLTIARPTQGQNINGGVEYAVGAPRNSKGCWTCLLRNHKCPDPVARDESGKCSECERFKLTCDYGRPSWWYNDKLKEERQQTCRSLVRQNRRRRTNNPRTNVHTQQPAPGPAPASPGPSRHSALSLIKTMQKRPASSLNHPTQKRSINGGGDEEETFNAATPPLKAPRLTNDAVSSVNRLPERPLEVSVEAKKSSRASVPKVPFGDMVDWESMINEEDHNPYAVPDWLAPDK